MRFTTGDSPSIPMRILMISDQQRSVAHLSGFLEKHSEAYWEISLEHLQHQEIWQERQPDLLVATLPIEAKHSHLIRDLQTQIPFSLLVYCMDLHVEALEGIWDIPAQAILVHPVTEPQLIATLHLIRLSQKVKANALTFDKLNLLSPREKEVLQLIRRGMSSKEIGSKLYVSMNTVNTHKRRIKEKLGVRRFVELGDDIPRTG